MNAPTCSIVGILIFSAGCQQQMADQPSYRPLAPSRLFADGRSARPLPSGAISRESIPSDSPVLRSVKPASLGKTAADPAAEGRTRPGPVAPTDPSRFVDRFPFRLSRDDLTRGQEVYTIYCALCHDPVGNGLGKIVERGYVRPPNFHEDDSRGFGRHGKSVPLREVPVGYVFQVVTDGFGAMPRYGRQIAPSDRWRVIGYLRALQLSQHARLDELPEAIRSTARSSLGGVP